MAMFTRTVKTCKATAYKLEKVNGEYVGVPFAEVDYSAATDNESEARKAFKDEGINVPRGSKIDVEVTRDDIYGCTVEEFMAIARIIER